MRRFLLLAAVLVSAAACQDSTGPGVQLTGTYQLQMINGQRLPYSFTDNSNGQFATLTADQLTLLDDGSYQDVATIVENGTSFPSTENGFYTSTNGSITFEPQNGSTYAGSLSGNVLTEIDGTLTEVFQKQ